MASPCHPHREGDRSRRCKLAANTIAATTPVTPTTAPIRADRDATAARRSRRSKARSTPVWIAGPDATAADAMDDRAGRWRACPVRDTNTNANRSNAITRPMMTTAPTTSTSRFGAAPGSGSTAPNDTGRFDPGRGERDADRHRGGDPRREDRGDDAHQPLVTAGEAQRTLDAATWLVEGVAPDQHLHHGGATGERGHAEGDHQPGDDHPCRRGERLRLLARVDHPERRDLTGACAGGVAFAETRPRSRRYRSTPAGPSRSRRSTSLTCSPSGPAIAGA